MTGQLLPGLVVLLLAVVLVLLLAAAPVPALLLGGPPVLVFALLLLAPAPVLVLALLASAQAPVLLMLWPLVGLLPLGEAAARVLVGRHAAPQPVAPLHPPGRLPRAKPVATALQQPAQHGHRRAALAARQVISPPMKHLRGLALLAPPGPAAAPSSWAALLLGRLAQLHCSMPPLEQHDC